MWLATIRRQGVTLIEVLVVIAILGVLIALIIPAVQSARENAVRMHNVNNHRQIILGIHQLTDQSNGRLNDLMKSSTQGKKVLSQNQSIFIRLVPILHGPWGEWQPGMDAYQLRAIMTPKVAAYRNPADYTWDLYPRYATDFQKISYAANMQAMDGSFSFVASLTDGSSQTMAIGDKHFATASPVNRAKIGQTSNEYAELFDPHPSTLYYGKRRATFCDKGWNDVMPVTDPVTRQTRSSIPGITFQSQPKSDEVDPRVLQTPFRAGLTAAMFDGSVRTISAGISENAYWSLITPRSGDHADVE